MAQLFSLGHMSAPVPTSQLVEASKVAVSFLSKAANSIPVIFGFMAVSVFLALSFPDEHIRYYSIASGIFFVIYMIVLRHVQMTYRRHAIWALKHLTKDERLVLQRYLKEDRAVCNFSVFHGASASLIGQGILVHATGTFPAFDAPVALQPYVRIYLRKHPELVGLKPDELGAAKLQDELNEYGA